MSVDIITKPGFDNWRGSTNVGFRDAALAARNAFAPVKGDEQRERYGFSLSGPLQKNRTSLSQFQPTASTHSTPKTIVAALPRGYFADSIPASPNDEMNVSARVEHMLTASQMLRAELQRNHTYAGNLGVGDFDLAERGYGQAQTENVFATLDVGRDRASRCSTSSASNCAGVDTRVQPGERRRRPCSS